MDLHPLRILASAAAMALCTLAATAQGTLVLPVSHRSAEGTAFTGFPFGRSTPMRVHDDLSHPGHVQDDTVIAQCTSRNIVTATSNRHVHPVFAGECDRMLRVGGISAPNDDRWETIDHGVPHLTCAVVISVARCDDLPFY